MSSPGSGVSGVGKTYKRAKLNTSSPQCLLVHVGMRGVQRAGFSLSTQVPAPPQSDSQAEGGGTRFCGLQREDPSVRLSQRHTLQRRASAADQLSLTNESHACLQGQQAYLERLEKSRNKISSKMKIPLGHLWMVLLYFLSGRPFLLIALTF